MPLAFWCCPVPYWASCHMQLWMHNSVGAAALVVTDLQLLDVILLL